MNKDLSRHIVVLDLVEFAIVLMDKIHVLGLDTLSELVYSGKGDLFKKIDGYDH